MDMFWCCCGHDSALYFGLSEIKRKEKKIKENKKKKIKKERTTNRKREEKRKTLIIKAHISKHIFNTQNAKGTPR